MQRNFDEKQAKLLELALCFSDQSKDCYHIRDDTETVNKLKLALKNVKTSQQFYNVVTDFDLGSPYEPDETYPNYSKGFILKAIAGVVLK